MSHDSQTSTESAPADSADGTVSHTRVVANWAAALATSLGAAAVLLFAYMEVLGTAGCSDRPCEHLGPDETSFTVITYGAPLVAAVAILLSFVTVRRGWGVLVPLVAWLLLIAAFVVMLATFP